MSKHIFLAILRWLKRLLNGKPMNENRNSSGISFSPDVAFFAVVSPTTPFVHFYKTNGTEVFKIPNGIGGYEPSNEESIYDELDREFPGYKESDHG